MEFKEGEIARDENGKEWLIFVDKDGFAMIDISSGKIDGLVLFLTPTESDRLKIVGYAKNYKKLLNTILLRGK